MPATHASRPAATMHQPCTPATAAPASHGRPARRSRDPRSKALCRLRRACTMALPLLVAALLVAAPRSKAVQAYVSCDSQGIVCRAGRGLIRDSDLGLTEALWVGPESKGIYIGSPSIWKTAAGPVVASHDFFGRSTLNATTQVLLDKSGRGSGGASRWVHAGNCSNMYWSSLFAHPHPQRQHELYLLGVSGASGNGGGAAGDRVGGKPPTSRRDIVISRSTNMGHSWLPPVTLFAASSTASSYHCAPTPVLVASDGRLHRAFEATVPGGRHGLAALMISTAAPVSASTDLLHPNSWVESSLVIPGAAEDASMWGLGWNQSTLWSWEEGNAIEVRYEGFPPSCGCWMEGS